MRCKNLLAIIFLSLAVLKMGGVVSPNQAWAQTDEYPKHFIYQTRGGVMCSYPYDCLSPESEIYYKLQLRPGPNGTCYIPEKNIAVQRFRLIATALTLNGVTIHRSDGSIGSPFNENCELVAKLEYNNLLAKPTHFPAPGANHYLRVKIYTDIPSNPKAVAINPMIPPLPFIYSFNTPVIVKDASTCQQEGQCSGSLNEITEYVWKICNQLIGFPDQYKRCDECVRQDSVWTAVGCIPTDAESMLQVLIRIGLMVGGGIALLIILAGAFILSISQGDPKKTSEAKDMITAALIGLIFIIFSVSILQFIGVQIFKIPDFGQRFVSRF